jgi:hypothetical protein
MEVLNKFPRRRILRDSDIAQVRCLMLDEAQGPWVYQDSEQTDFGRLLLNKSEDLCFASDGGDTDVGRLTLGIAQSQWIVHNGGEADFGRLYCDVPEEISAAMDSGETDIVRLGFWSDVCQDLSRLRYSGKTEVGRLLPDMSDVVRFPTNPGHAELVRLDGDVAQRQALAHYVLPGVEIVAAHVLHEGRARERATSRARREQEGLVIARADEVAGDLPEHVVHERVKRYGCVKTLAFDTICVTGRVVESALGHE